MKYYLLFIICVFSVKSRGQSSLMLSYNKMYVAKSMGLSFQQRIKRHYLKITVAQIFNNKPDYDRNNVFLRQAYGRNLKEKLALGFSYHFRLIKFNPSVRLMLGYQLYYTHTRLRTLAFVPAIQDSSIEQIKLYTKRNYDLTPQYNLEHNLSIAMHIDLGNQFFIKLSGGVGFVGFYDLDFHLSAVNALTRWWGEEWALSHFYSLGVGYHLGGKEK